MRIRDALDLELVTIELPKRLRWELGHAGEAEDGEWYAEQIARIVIENWESAETNSDSVTRFGGNACNNKRTRT